MICPHCNKEVDSYTVYGQNANLNLNQGCASGILSYTLTVANAGETTTSLSQLGEVTLTPAYGGNTVCANQQLGHYHTL